MQTYNDDVNTIQSYIVNVYSLQEVMDTMLHDANSILLIVNSIQSYVAPFIPSLETIKSIQLLPKKGNLLPLPSVPTILHYLTLSSQYGSS